MVFMPSQPVRREGEGVLCPVNQYGGGLKTSLKARARRAVREREKERERERDLCSRKAITGQNTA